MLDVSDGVTLSSIVMQSESRKLRWFAPIWEDPLRWARGVGNSRLRLLCAIAVHLAFWGMWCFGVSMLASGRVVSEASLNTPLLCTLSIIAFVPCVLIPSLYVYALYRLIRIIDENRRA
jgi:hypothetical protein